MSVFGLWFCGGIILGIALFGSILNGIIALRPYFSEWICSAKIYIIQKLKKSDKFMKWLYSEEKSLSEQISEEFCDAQVSFIRTDWRN